MTAPVLVSVLVEHLPRRLRAGITAPELAPRFEAALRRRVDEDGWSVPQVALRLAALDAGPEALLDHLESGRLGLPSDRELAATEAVRRNHRRADLRAEAEEPPGPPASPASTQRHLAHLRELLAARHERETPT